MNDEKSQAIAWFFSINVYLTIALSYTLLTQGGAQEFCVSLGILCGCRVMFAVLEGAGDYLAWHLHGRHASAQSIASVPSPIRPAGRGGLQ